MSKEPIQISREELYEKVWTAPRSQMAKESDISDVALAKKSKKLDIAERVPNQPSLVFLLGGIITMNSRPSSFIWHRRTTNSPLARRLEIHAVASILVLVTLVFPAPILSRQVIVEASPNKAQAGQSSEPDFSPEVAQLVEQSQEAMQAENYVLASECLTKARRIAPEDPRLMALFAAAKMGSDGMDEGIRILRGGLAAAKTEGQKEVLSEALAGVAESGVRSCISTCRISVPAP
jgi:hypothetical protein